MGCYFLLRGFFPAQGLNPCLLHWHWVTVNSVRCNYGMVSLLGCMLIYAENDMLEVCCKVLRQSCWMASRYVKWEDTFGYSSFECRQMCKLDFISARRKWILMGVNHCPWLWMILSLIFKVILANEMWEKVYWRVFLGRFFSLVNTDSGGTIFVFSYSSTLLWLLQCIACPTKNCSS